MSQTGTVPIPRRTRAPLRRRRHPGSRSESAPSAHLRDETGPIWSRPFAAIFVVSLVVSTAQSVMIATIPVFAAGLGAAPFVVGFISGAFAVTALALRPFVGPLSARFADRRLFVASLAIMAAAFLTYGLFGSHLELLFVGRLVHGVGMGLFAPISLALVAGTLPGGRMATGIGVFSVSQALAMAAGPAIGLVAAGAFGYPPIFFAAAAATAAVLLLVPVIPRAARVAAAPFRMSWRTVVASEALLPAVVLFLLTSAFAVIQAFVVVVAHLRGIAEPWVFFTAYAVSLLVARPIAGRLSDRRGTSRVVLWSIALFAVSLGVLAAGSSLSAMVAAAVLMGFGFGVSQPLLQGLAMAATSPERRALAGNTLYVGIDLAYLTMPLLAGAGVGFLSDTVRWAPRDAYSLIFLVMGVPVLAAALVFVLSRRRAAARRAQAR